MALLGYGNAYFGNDFAGVLREEPDGRFVFAYREAYLNSGRPAIAYTIPLQTGPIHSQGGLHPFFDNLVSEGWLANAQARALNIQPGDRFSRLLAFGHECAGAVSVLDPKPRPLPDLDLGSAGEIAALASRASISGAQPKLLAVKTPSGYRAANSNETSTHIAKLPPSQLRGIVDLEYLSSIAAAEFLKPDRVVELEIAEVAGLPAACLLVRRFDRRDDGSRIHFEEFNQILGRPSEAKYEGAYSEMAAFMRENPRCETADIASLFRRTLASILLGNNDAHMKNFGLLYTGAGMRLAPTYDFVAAALYPEFNSAMALRIGVGTNPRKWSDMGPRHVETLAKSLGLKQGTLIQAVRDFETRLNAAEAAVNDAPHGKPALKTKLIQFMRKRWNGTFNSIGKK